MAKLVIFRVDASLEIGTGHVMRCLTLARALKIKKVRAEFICRNHEGNLIDFIERDGFTVHTIPKIEGKDSRSITPIRKDSNPLDHASWLGVSQERDIRDSSLILGKLGPDWLIVDHYALDKTWETGVHSLYSKLMVIDDLADREHACELLLDQTFGRNEADYEHLVPSACLLLTGSMYALLRTEFSHWREKSLKRRENVQFDRLLITMGGIDKDNITEKIIDQLEECDLHSDLKITIVMGPSAPYLSNILDKVTKSHLKLSVESNVTDMAELMSNSDFCIGASGATTWERSCLGLPTIQIISADNQGTIAKNVSNYGAALTIRSDEVASLDYHIKRLKRDAETLVSRSSAITDGKGTDLVLDHLLC